MKDMYIAIAMYSVFTYTIEISIALEARKIAKGWKNTKLCEVVFSVLFAPVVFPISFTKHIIRELKK